VELASVFHYFINSHSITEENTAADFEKYALHAIEEIFLENDIAIMVGGTGLYIKAFAEGLDDIPRVDPEIRKMLISDYEERGLNWLQKEVQERDPLYFAYGEIQNPQRMLRALEVKMSTGNSILDFRTK
jgi:tRNA dimethylallyltransferase